MAKERLVKVTVVGEDRGGSKALKDVGDQAEATEKKVKKSGDAFKGAAIAVGGQLLSKELGGVLNELGATAVELDIFARKSKTVFEGSAADVESWAKKNAHAMGLTDQELVGLAANFGDLVKPMGFSAEQAAKMSEEVVGLSGVLSAWSGGQRTAAEVSDILTKAMLGETDGLKGLGISISAADVSAKLLASGQGELTGKAREQAEAVAIQALIFEKSSDAQKAWADGSLDAAKKQNQLKATIAEVREEIATRFGPALTYAGTAIETLGPIAAGVGGIAQATGLSLKDMVGKIGPVAGKLGLIGVAAGTVAYALANMNDKMEWSGLQIDKLAGLSTNKLIAGFQDMGSVSKKWGLDVEGTFRSLAETSFGSAKRMVDALEAVSNKTADQKAMLAAFKPILEQVAAAQVQAGKDAGVHAEGQDTLAGSVDGAAAAIDGLNISLDEMLGKNISVVQATIDYDNQLREMTRSIDEGTYSLDLHSEAGGKTAEQLLGLITQSIEVTDKMEQEGQGADAVAEAHRNQAAEIGALLERMGPLPPELQKIYDRWRKIAGLPDITKNITVTTTMYEAFGVPSRYRFDTGGVVGLAGGGPAGFVTNGPQFLVGEGNPAHPEVVIATDPMYHQRNVGLWQHAGKKLGMMAAGGVTGSGWVGGGGSDQPLVVQVVLDGRVLAESVVSHIPQMKRRDAGVLG